MKDELFVLSADMDADGKDDRVYQVGAPPATDARYPETDDWEIRVGLCTAAGVRDEIPVYGMGEIWGVDDLDGDGRDDIKAGGTTVSAGYTSFYPLVGSRLRVIRYGDNDFTLVDGTENAATPRLFAWVCSDVLGDARREAIQVMSKWPPNDNPTWRVTTYRIDGLEAVQVREDTGEFDNLDSRNELEDRFRAMREHLPPKNACSQR